MQGGVMKKIVLSPTWIKRNEEKLKLMYSYAVTQKLDINSQKDILIILQVIDTENANEAHVEAYQRVLQLFRVTFREAANKALEQ
jgi:hypothetical protein